MTAYLKILQDKQDLIHEGQRRALRWVIICAGLFELSLASAVEKFAFGPLELRELRLVVLALPGVIGYGVSAVLGHGVLGNLLAVSESACLRVLYRVEWMLGIDAPLRHLPGLRDHHLDSWGQPIESSRVRRAYGLVLWVYVRLVGLLLLFYAPVAIVRSGWKFGFDQPILWVVSLLTLLSTARAVLAQVHARGVWKLDEDMPPLAHMMADETVRDWQAAYASERSSGADQG